MNEESRERLEFLASPTVAKFHKGRVLLRPGRGFSVHELRQSTLTLAQAKKLRIHVDQRRKTAYKSNSDLLNRLAEQQ